MAFRPAIKKLDYFEGIESSGQVNYLPKWIGEKTLGNSLIFEEIGEEQNLVRVGNPERLNTLLKVSGGIEARSLTVNELYITNPFEGLLKLEGGEVRQAIPGTDYVEFIDFVRPLETSANIVSLLTQMSITYDDNGLKMVGDVDEPGNNKFYGTDENGIRGWYDLPSGDFANKSLSNLENVSINTHLIPQSNSLIDLGSYNFPFRYSYLNEIYLTDPNKISTYRISEISRPGRLRFLIDGSNYYGTYEFFGTGPGYYLQIEVPYFSNGEILFNAVGLERFKFRGHIRPTSNNLYDLGGSTLQWRNLYSSKIYLNNNDLDALLNNKVSKTGDETISGIKTFTAFPLLPSFNPTEDLQAVHKKYVDEVVVLNRVSKEPVLDADLYQEPNNPSDGDRYLISDSQYDEIVEVIVPENCFVVSGNKMDIYLPQTKIKVKKSTANNGKYTVSQSNYFPPPFDRTYIYVIEQIPSDIADGNIHYCLGENWRQIGVDYLVEFQDNNWVSDGEPQDGWFVLALDDATQWFYYGDSWIQTGKGQTYEAGNGLILENNVFSVNIHPERENNRGLKFDGGKLVINYDDITIGMIRGGLGFDRYLGVKENSIQNYHLRGGITDDKLQQIASANKVSGSALTKLASIPSDAGLIPSYNLGTGTPDNTKFLRGDRVWATPPSGGEPNVWFVLNPINTNTWYLPVAINCTALTTLTLTTNRIYYIPFVPEKTITVNSLAIEVTTASAGTGQVGIYNSNANYRPNSLLGYISIDTGTTGVKSGNVSISLTAGNLYWLAIINTSAAVIRGVAVGGNKNILGIATGTSAFNTHYFQAGSDELLPSTANATTNATGTVPAIYIRYSVS